MGWRAKLYSFVNAVTKVVRQSQHLCTFLQVPVDSAGQCLSCTNLISLPRYFQGLCPGLSCHLSDGRTTVGSGDRWYEVCIQVKTLHARTRGRNSCWFHLLPKRNCFNTRPVQTQCRLAQSGWVHWRTPPKTNASLFKLCKQNTQRAETLFGKTDVNALIQFLCWFDRQQPNFWMWHLHLRNSRPVVVKGKCANEMQVQCFDLTNLSKMEGDSMHHWRTLLFGKHNDFLECQTVTAAMPSAVALSFITLFQAGPFCTGRSLQCHRVMECILQENTCSDLLCAALQRFNDFRCFELSVEFAWWLLNVIEF